MAAASATPLGRPADRMKHIVRELRGQIVTGALPPGQQLPTRVEIEQHFGASSTTVQKALEHLRRDGFVEVNGRQGTFVSPHPPRLTRYGLVFPQAPGTPGWARFWTALQNEALNIERGPRSRPLRLPVYYGLDGRTDSPDYRHLLEDVQSHKLAGLIFATSTHKLDSTPLLRDHEVPRVVIYGQESSEIPNAVHLDRASFSRKALAYLLEKGRRRIAILSISNQDGWLAEWHSAAAEFDLPLQPYWLQSVHVDTPEAAKNLTHLLFRDGSPERPDGFIVSDDNLVEHASAGLIAAGARVPDDVEVVAHCNFPWPVPSALPVRRLGFDARRILAACIAGVDRQLGGEALPIEGVISAVFQDEIEKVGF